MHVPGMTRGCIILHIPYARRHYAVTSFVDSEKRLLLQTIHSLWPCCALSVGSTAICIHFYESPARELYGRTIKALHGS